MQIGNDKAVIRAVATSVIVAWSVFSGTDITVARRSGSIVRLLTRKQEVKKQREKKDLTIRMAVLFWFRI
jgi:hypothetical protein